MGNYDWNKRNLIIKHGKYYLDELSANLGIRILSDQEQINDSAPTSEEL